MEDSVHHVDSQIDSVHALDDAYVENRGMRHQSPAIRAGDEAIDTGGRPLHLVGGSILYERDESMRHPPASINVLQVVH